MSRPTASRSSPQLSALFCRLDADARHLSNAARLPFLAFDNDSKWPFGCGQRFPIAFVREQDHAIGERSVQLCQSEDRTAGVSSLHQHVLGKLDAMSFFACWCVDQCEKIEGPMAIVIS